MDVLIYGDNVDVGEITKTLAKRPLVGGYIYTLVSFLTPGMVRVQAMEGVLANAILDTGHRISETAPTLNKAIDMLMSRLKCWYVFDRDEDGYEYSDIVFANTPGQAKARAWFVGDLDWTDIRARRYPELDGHPSYTDRDLFELGSWWLSCRRCDQVPDEPVFDEAGKAFCSDNCRKQSHYGD